MKWKPVHRKNMRVKKQAGSQGQVGRRLTPQQRQGSRASTHRRPVIKAMLAAVAFAFANGAAASVRDAQGRDLPLVRLEPVPIGGIYPAGNEDRVLVRLDTVPKHLVQALLATEGVKIEFQPAAIKRLAEIAWQVNEKTENIGARRLHTLLERLLETELPALQRLDDGLELLQRSLETRLFGIRTTLLSHIPCLTPMRG